MYLGPVTGYFETFRGFPHSLQKNAKKVPQIGSRPPLPTSLPESELPECISPSLCTSCLFYISLRLQYFLIYLSLSMSCVTYSKRTRTHGRTDAKLWLTFTSQNNALDNKLPRTRVSNPRPKATCVNYVSAHYKNGTTIKAVSYNIYCDFCKCVPLTGPQ